MCSCASCQPKLYAICRWGDVAPRGRAEKQKEPRRSLQIFGPRMHGMVKIWFRDGVFQSEFDSPYLWAKQGNVLTFCFVPCMATVVAFVNAPTVSASAHKPSSCSFLTYLLGMERPSATGKKSISGLCGHARKRSLDGQESLTLVQWLPLALRPCAGLGATPALASHTLALASFPLGLRLLPLFLLKVSAALPPLPPLLGLPLLRALVLWPPLRHS